MQLLFPIFSTLFAFILYFNSLIPTKVHSNVLLENTLTPEQVTHPDVLAVIKNYKKNARRLVLIIVISCFLYFFLPYDSLQITYFLLQLFCGVGAFQWIEIKSIHNLWMVKQKNHWYSSENSTILVDTKLVLQKNKKMLSKKWFFFQLLIYTLLSIYCFYGMKNTQISLFQTGVGSIFYLFMWISYQSIARSPVKMISSNAEINKQYNDIWKKNWSILIILSLVWFNLFIFLFVSSFYINDRYWSILAWVLVLSVFVFVFSIMYLLFTTRKKQDQISSRCIDADSTDEDQYWKYVVYINPNNPALFVPNRTGTNLSINLGRKKGILFAAAILLSLLLLLSGLTFTLFQADFSTKGAFQMDIQSDHLTLSSPLTENRTIFFDSIEKITLIEEIPTASKKIMGTATNTFLAGSFQLGNNKFPAQFYVYTKAKLFIKIETSTTTYYFTDKTSSQTNKVYQNLIRKKSLGHK